MLRGVNLVRGDGKRRIAIHREHKLDSFYYYCYYFLLFKFGGAFGVWERNTAQMNEQRTCE